MQFVWKFFKPTIKFFICSFKFISICFQTDIQIYLKIFSTSFSFFHKTKPHATLNISQYTKSLFKSSSKLQKTQQRHQLQMFFNLQDPHLTHSTTTTQFIISYLKASIKTLKNIEFTVKIFLNFASKNRKLIHFL